MAFLLNMLSNRPVCPNCESRLVLKLRNEDTFAPEANDTSDIYRCYRCFNSFKPGTDES